MIFAFSPPASSGCAVLQMAHHVTETAFRLANGSEGSIFLPRRHPATQHGILLRMSQTNPEAVLACPHLLQSSAVPRARCVLFNLSAVARKYVKQELSFRTHSCHTSDASSAAAVEVEDTTFHQESSVF